MEELELDLNQEEAASLFLLLETAIDALKSKAKVLESIQAMPKDERPAELKEEDTIIGVIKLNHKLVEDGLKLQNEVGKIVVELEKSQEQKPIIIKPPSWGKSN